MDTLSSVQTLSRTQWLSQAKKNASQVQSQVIGALPQSSQGALGSSLMNTIYDSKAITSRVLNAYWKRTGSDPAQSVPQTNTTASSTNSANSFPSLNIQA